MKKSIPIIISFMLGIATMFGIAGCNSGTQDDWQSKMEELQSQIEEMENKLSEMEESLADKNKQILDRDKRIEKLEKNLREIQNDDVISYEQYDRLDNTEKQLSYQTASTVMCAIEDAYEKHWLTRTDLAYAMYYARGEVYTCEKSDWDNGNTEVVKKIDFAPEEQCPAINKQVEFDIKKHYFERRNFEEDLTFEEFEQNFSFRFVGSYNGTFVITDIKTVYWDYPTDVPPPVWIAGFVWSGIYANNLFVFKYE